MKKKPNRPLRLGLALLALALVIQFLATQFPVYGRPLRALGGLTAAAMGRIFGLVPFPVIEWLILLLVPALVAPAVFLVRRHGARGGILRLGSRLVLLLGVLALLFVLNLGVQYGAPTLLSRAGLTQGLYSTEQLAELTSYLLDQANASAPLAPRDSAGNCDFGSFKGMSTAIDAAYRAVAAGETDFSPLEPRLIAPARPKRTVVLGRALSYLGISGVYYPFTGESLVSSDELDVMLPFTIAHEAAHAHGIGPENEANMMAFLACLNNPALENRPDITYSMWFNAYRYASNALYRADRDRWQAIFDRRSDLVAADLRALDAHWARFDTPVQAVGTAVNDAYIKATGQADGVRSYGMVVDLLLAWYDCTSAKN